jgi:Flp pilus assembly protein CpaB
MQRGRLLILLGIILGLATLGAVAFLFLGSGGLPDFTGPPPTEEVVTPLETGIPTTQVIVALQPIGRGSEFVAGSIGRRDWPANNVPPEVIADEAETIGKVAKTDVVQGQIIVRSMLVDVAGAGEASFQIPTGRVAVAYPIDRQRSVAFAIQPGDFVDILVTAYFLDVDEEFQTTLPNKIQFFFPVIDQETGEPIGFNLSTAVDQGRFEIATDDLPGIVFPRENQIPRRVAQLTVQAAKVVRVGPWIEPPPPPTPEGAGDGTQEGEPVPTPTPNLPDIVTLAVNPQDALVLLWLRQSGIYTEMALRAAGEENADHLTEAVTLQYMLTRFNVAVPPKIEFVMASSISNLEELSVIVEQDTPTPNRAQ